MRLIIRISRWVVLAFVVVPLAYSQEGEAAHFLAELIKIDTSNPPGNETKAAEYLKSVLEKEGIPAQIYESAPGRGNIVARLKGNGKKRPLLLLAHLDVVGVERSKWTVDPFAAFVKDGYMYGRGSVDDKGMVAANLEVLLRLHREKVPLDRDVIFLAEAGEEGTAQFGIEFMIAKHWDQIESELALNEGGTALIENGKIKYFGVATTEKVPRGMTLVAHGTSGHGSIPRLDNPVVHISAAVAKVGTWQTPMRLNETTKLFFERLANISEPKLANALRHLDDENSQRLLASDYPELYSKLRTSIVPTIVKGGFRVNVIPAEAEATLDIRALPDEDIDRLLAQMKELINDPAVEIRRDPANNRPFNPPSPVGSEMFAALEHAQRKLFPDSVTLPDMLTGATDGAELRAKGVEVYGIGAPKTADDSKRIHGNDERMPLAGLDQFVQCIDAATREVVVAK
jgi:acetylornithine deacetylase/succinyl-diaminopimelate desuccinylase-like protein